MQTTKLKYAEVNELEKQIVWQNISNFIDPTVMEFSNPTDMESMHLFLIDALKELENYKDTLNDVAGMKAFAVQCFWSASRKVEYVSRSV